MAPLSSAEENITTIGEVICSIKSLQSFLCSLALITIVITGCSEDETNRTPDPLGQVSDQHNQCTPRGPGSWLTYGQTYKEQRFSMLTQINKTNIQELGLEWHKDIGGPTEKCKVHH